MALFSDSQAQIAAQQPNMFSAPGTPAPALDPSQSVEGRINGLLKQDDKGNYINPVVQQAENRQLQAANGRGLLNTSMALQGAQEAVISKAADIAAPDARLAYDQSASNRGAYQTATQAISTNYQRQLDTINASSMTPEDKSVAIAQAGAARDGELAFQNNLYSRQPGWQQDWLAPAVNGAGMDVGSVNNQDTLANIAGDPAQTQQMRDAATQRLQAIRASGAMYGGASSSTLPPPLRPQYDTYRAQGGTLPPDQWLTTVYQGGQVQQPAYANLP